ncbi:hypothetical protein A1O7_06047 [Cladophialophora yegresii CBS 114405]|uniref:Cytochrome P450 oxidoreductase n=1 Tax=Cladophialophora yegresii CBS 114405 TaxID=1182544 RepID=W9W0X0_9EURO|nr:uncharacterized protein A1O7_06047 [Cladophialophora yegresii CBS 114405]EXJ58620.1 hypothetical protein A1O7_06047 [Cladophialophora yegresii CBS 114405]
MDGLLKQSPSSLNVSMSVAVAYGALALCLALAGLCWTYRNRGFWTSRSANSAWIGGPEGKAFIGNLRELQTNGAASCKAWYSLYERYGPAYEMTIPFFRLHVINHPVYLEHIQKHNSKNYIRGAFTRNVFGELHRRGIFVADGAEWHVQRKAATRAFSKRNFETHITRSLHHWLDVLMRLLSNLAREQKTFDLQSLMSRFMFCLFLGIAFHEDELALAVMSADPKSLETTPEYVEALDRALYLFDRRRRYPLWRLTEKLSGEDKTSKRAAALFYAQIDGLIKKRLDMIKNGYKPSPDDGVDLLDLFMQSTDDPHTLGGMVFGILVAGRDTTAYSISWLMKEIHHQDNKHLDAAQKIRAEAKELGFTTGYLGYGDTPKMRFANAMWHETARLNTVSPAGQMEAAEDDVLPAVPDLNMRPRRIKKGDVVSYQNYVLSRMPEVWGEDATVFNPYRWFTENGESLSYSPFSKPRLVPQRRKTMTWKKLTLECPEYHSWNAGPRSCLGRALATYEGIATSTAILQRFDISLADDSRVYEPLAAMNMVR